MDRIGSAVPAAWSDGLTGWADAWLGEELQAAGLVGVELRSAEVGWSVARTRSAPRARGHGSGHHLQCRGWSVASLGAVAFNSRAGDVSAITNIPYK